MDRFKKILLVACVAVAAFSAVNLDNTAEAGDFGCHGGVCLTPGVNLYHAPLVRPVVPVVPVVHCQYRVFIYDCGIWRCIHTCNSPLVAQQKVLLLRSYGYLTTVRKIIL